MDIVNVTVGYNLFEKYTLPMVESMQKHNPEIPIVLVDNGSEPPYPEVEGITQVTFDNSSLSGAWNKGFDTAGDHDWYLWMNNDVLVEAPIKFPNLNENCLYGPDIISRGDISYIVAWWLLISKEAWKTIGEFDPGYKHYTYEDVDYGIRAERAGFELQVRELPLKHFEHGSQPLNPDLNEYRKQNIRYLKSKFSIKENDGRVPELT